MASIGSETYRSSNPVESQTKETKISEGAVLPETVKGEDWPAPTIDGLNPDFMEVPGPSAYIVIHGTGYTEKSVVLWDAGLDTVEMPCEFVNEGKLRLMVTNPGGEYELPAEIPIAVRNIAVQTGELVSNTAIFTFKAAEEEAPARKRHGR